VLGRILKEHSDQVRLIFKDFPLDFHALARPAHEAARCAGESGKYWEYHDRLFEGQPAFARGDLIRYATELGLPENRFVPCLDSGRFKALVEADIQEGRQAGIRGTPTFFINGQRLLGAAPYEAFKELIEEALDKKERK
jgi:protein-disulfide isomerase